MSAVLRRCLLLLALAGPAFALPYIPTDGKTVVEQLPARASPVQRELRGLRKALTTSPHDLGLATTLAQRYIEQARIEGDPRYLGYAQAALAPWWKLPEAPPAVLVLRATLRQSSHQFGPALADLDLAVRADSSNVQAWLTRATVQLILGDFKAAKASCMRLYSRAPQLVVQSCLSNVSSLSGHARPGYESLKTALAQHPAAEPGVRTWVVTLLAEMAARLGDKAAAEAWFHQALAAGDADAYLLAAFADFLLDQRRAAQVVPLLQDKTRNDALLLRYAIALQAIGAHDAPAQIEALRNRYDAAMLRGDTVHQREQSRFELVLRKNPGEAVRLAKLNWAVQKEPADLRILSDSALASGDAEALRLVQQWRQQSGLEDATISGSAL